jgi:muconolactone D-isomerase
VLFAVTMDVALPVDMDSDQRADVLAWEKAYSQDLQRGGEWVSIWRCVGQYANLSISTSPTTSGSTRSSGGLSRSSAT